MPLIPTLIKAVALSAFFYLCPLAAAPKNTNTLFHQLANSEEWLKLMHYKTDSKGFKSAVDGGVFFLSDKGKTDPYAELKANYQAIFNNKQPINNDHPRCQFVARSAFLIQALSLNEDKNPPEACQSYHHWKKKINPNSLTLVFPASYLNSPSSMFGHTLLRIDPPNIQNDSVLLSYALSFGADINQDEVGTAYIFKGLSGGYPGSFTLVPYFTKLKTYNALENRDIWEYQLDLNPDEVKRLTDHAWELKDASFDYYFLLENCSYRLLELLEYARPSLKLTHQFSYAAIPSETVKTVINAGLVNKRSYRPSDGLKIQHRATRLPAALRYWITRVAEKPESLQSNAFKALTKQQQADIIEAAYGFEAYRHRQKVRSKETTQNRFQLLQALKQHKPQALIQKTPVNPVDGHSTKLWRVSIGEENRNAYLETEIRLSYHDLLDPIDGFLPASQLLLGGISLREQENDTLRVQNLTLIDIRSYSSWLPLFDPISWEVGLGLDRSSQIENNALGFAGFARMGKSAGMTKNGVARAMMGLEWKQFSRNKNGKSYFNPDLQLGWLQYSDWGTSEVLFSWQSIQRQSDQIALKLRHNLPLKKNHALRFSWNHSQQSNEKRDHWQMDYRFYF